MKNSSQVSTLDFVWNSANLLMGTKKWFDRLLTIIKLSFSFFFLMDGEFQVKSRNLWRWWLLTGGHSLEEDRKISEFFVYSFTWLVADQAVSSFIEMELVMEIPLRRSITKRIVNIRSIGNIFLFFNFQIPGCFYIPIDSITAETDWKLHKFAQKVG